MGTRRRYRYRGGDPFIPNPNATGPAGEEREKKRYQAWLAKRNVEAVEDAKGREENAKMAAFNAKQAEARKAEIEELRLKKSEEKQDEVNDVNRPSNTDITDCKKILKSHGIMSLNNGKVWLKDKENRKVGADVFAQVSGCVKTIEASRQGSGRKTRRRKSRRRR